MRVHVILKCSIPQVFGTMKTLALVFMLHFTWTFQFSSGEYLEESNTVYAYGLPELTRDILERIKAATGQPINTSRFVPILTASSKDYETIEYQPYTKTSKFLEVSGNNKLEGGNYHINKGGKDFGNDKGHNYRLGEHGKKGKEALEHEYGDHEGKSHKYNEESYYKKNHHKSNRGKKGGKSKKGRKHGKFHVEKGYRDIYHKDEEKKSDFYWNNQHEEGKWIEYGFKNKKSKKSHDKGDEGKKEKGKTEESSYEKKEDKCTKCKTQ